MRFNKALAAVLAFLISMSVCLSPVLILAEPSDKPSASDTEDNDAASAHESGIVRGTNSTAASDDEDDEDTDDSRSEKKESSTAAPKATDEPEPTATPNPEVDEDGLPILGEQEAAVLVNAVNGEVMYEHNADMRVYPASTTKIMTALLTLEAIDREEINLESAFLIMPEMLEDLPADGSSMLLKEGEAMTVRYLLEGLLIESGNDAAQALAIIVCGDIETFVQRMNDKAEELGMTGTHFVNPHGLHDDDHYTTARDLSKLTQEAMKNLTFREIVSMTQATIPATDYVGTRTFINTNGLLSTIRYTDYYYQYAIGVKTGHTSQAGYCLVSAAKKGNLEVIGVAMNCETEKQRHTVSRNMLSYAIDNFKTVTAVTKGDMISEIKVKFGSGSDHTTLSTDSDIMVTIPVDADTDELTLETVTEDYITAPVSRGDEIGTVNVVLNGDVVGSGTLYADTTVKKHPLGFIMQFFSFIWSFMIVKIVIIALLIIIIIFIAYMFINIRKNIKIAERRRRVSGKRRSGK